MKPSGSARLTVSSLTRARRKKVLRLRPVRHGGSSVIATRPAAEPFASQLLPRLCTPMVPPGLIRGPDNPADGAAGDIDLEVGHPQPDLADIDLQPPSLRASAEQGAGPGRNRVHPVVADREPLRFDGQAAGPGCKTITTEEKNITE